MIKILTDFDYLTLRVSWKSHRHFIEKKVLWKNIFTGEEKVEYL